MESVSALVLVAELVPGLVAGMGLEKARERVLVLE